MITIATETSDGITGTITIDDTTYDLGDGSLLLISTQHGGTSVKQIRFDVTGFPTESEQLRRIADENPEIGEFFRQAMEIETDDTESGDDA